MSETFHNGNPYASVLIPAFNVESVIERAVNSALQQSLRNIEIIVIDDHSSDRTAEAAQELAKKHENVRLIQSSANRGPGAARARGLSVARGDWIAILDADDRFEPERLRSLLEIAEAEDLDSVADNLQLIDPYTLSCSGAAFPMRSHERVVLTPEVLLRHTVPAGRINLGWCQPVVKRAFLQKSNLTWRDYRHAEDFLFAMEMLLSGARFSIVGHAGYLYTQRRGTESRQASPHSRTNRSAREQQAVIDDLLVRYDSVIHNDLRSGLLQMRSQISVASHLLDLRDGLDERNLLTVISALARACKRPQTLLSCAAARYGPRSKVITPSTSHPPIER